MSLGLPCLFGAVQMLDKFASPSSLGRLCDCFDQAQSLTVLNFHFLSQDTGFGRGVGEEEGGWILHRRNPNTLLERPHGETRTLMGEK